MLSRTNLVPLGLIVLMMAVVSVEAGLLWRSRLRASRAIAGWEQMKQARDRLTRQMPAPTPGNAASTARAVAEVRRRLDDMRRALTLDAGRGHDDPLPARPADSFFALEKLCEDLRRQAEAGRVRLRVGERFGFASHAREAPPVEWLPEIHRQAWEVRQVVGHLLAAHPVALLSVRREHSAAGERLPPASGAEDFFIPSTGRLVRKAGTVESDALRLEFTGRTAVLREFMRALGESEHPFLVRAVEVEPVAAGAGSVSVDVKFSVLLEAPRLAAKPDASR